MNHPRSPWASLVRWRSALERRLLLSHPLLWSMRVPGVLAVCALLGVAACALLCMMPVDLETPWVPSSEQVFYILGLVVVVLLGRWAVETVRRWRSPVHPTPLVGGALSTYLLCSLVITAFVAVPFVAAHVQRLHIVNASVELPVIAPYWSISAVASACASEIRRACAEDDPGADPRIWRDHPTCETLPIWSSLQRTSASSSEDHEWFRAALEFHLDPQTDKLMPITRALAVERVVKSLGEFVHEAGLDPEGLYAVRLSEYRHNTDTIEPFRICGESMRQVEPLYQALLFVQARVSQFIRQSDETIAPHRTNLYVCGFLTTYLALLLVVTRVVSRTAMRNVLLMIFGTWGLASFFSVFFQWWDQRQFVEFLLIMWGVLVGAGALGSVRRRSWGFAAASGLGAVLLAPLVPFLASWSVHEWEFRDPIFSDGVLEIVRGILTEPSERLGRRPEVIRVGGWCVVGGWSLTGLLLLPYQWIAFRAASLPSLEGDG